MHAELSPDRHEQDGGILWFNAVFLIATPLLALVLTPLYIYHYGVHWSEPVALIALWWATGMGITAGYHRMFSHRAWWAPAPIRFVFLVLGAAAWQNSAIAWCAGHRYHHRDVDTDDDPYTITKGFLYAHMLWIMTKGARHDDFDNVPDLWRDKLCVWQHKYYFWIGLGFNLLVPLMLGLMTGRVVGMLLWAGLLRIVMLHHFTFFINSLAHMWGRRTWSDIHSARDNDILAVLTLGEGYHNFHHTFPSDYRNGLCWYHYDPTKWLIWILHRLGLASNLRRTTIDRRLKKRWEFMRSRYEEQMDQWSEGIREQLVEAEQRFELALEQARQTRRDWSHKAEQLHAQARKELEDACREAERNLIVEFRNFKRLAKAVRA